VLAYGSIDGTTLRSDDGGQSWAARGGDLITPIVASGQGFLGLRDQDVVTSNDGRSWRTVASLDVPTLDHWTGMVAVDGGFVLVGVGFEGAGSVPQALVYVSRDGRTWKGLPDDPTLQGIQLVDVTTDGNSVVVFGHEGALVPGSWRGTFAASAASLFEAASHVPAATPTPLASASPAASPSAATSPNTTPSRAP
jgi:hypothetical protein